MRDSDLIQFRATLAKIVSARANMEDNIRLPKHRIPMVSEGLGSPGMLDTEPAAPAAKTTCIQSTMSPATQHVSSVSSSSEMVSQDR